MEKERREQAKEHHRIKLRPSVVKVHITAAYLHLTRHLDAEDGRHEEVNEEGDHGQVKSREGLEGVRGVHGHGDEREKGTEAHEPAHGGGFPPERLRSDDLVQLEGPEAKAGHRGRVEKGGRRARPYGRP